MCKTHYDEVLSLIAMIASNAPSCIEIVGLIKDTENEVSTIFTNVPLDVAIERLQRSLDLAKEAKRQTDAGVMHVGDTPPTAH